MTLKQVFELNGSKFPFRAKCEPGDMWWEQHHKGKLYITFTHIDPTHKKFYVCSELNTPCIHSKSTDWLPVEEIKGTLLEIKNSGVSFPFTVRHQNLKETYEIYSYDESIGKFEVYNVTERRFAWWVGDVLDKLELIPSEIK